MFASLAEAVLSGGGYAYGSAMFYDGERLTVKHICVSDKNELNKLKGSKYVHSEIGYIYRDVKNKLALGKPVKKLRRKLMGK